jgi:nuclear protein localization protein 4 homolog
MNSLLKLGAPDIQDSKQAPPGQAQKRFELARFLSDFHLVAYLGTTGLFAPVRIYPFDKLMGSLMYYFLSTG